MSAPATAAASTPRGQARRQEILDAALRLVGEQGVSAVTHRAVAAAAGVPTGSIAYYFGSLDALLDAALRHFVEEEAVRLRAATRTLRETGEQTDRTLVVSGVVAAIGLTATQQLAQFELYLEAARRPALRDAAADCLESFFVLAERSLSQLGAPEPRQGARALVAVLDGLAMQRVVLAEPDFDEQVALPAILAVVAAFAPPR